MRRLLRILFLSDLEINKAYPLRMALFYWITVLLFIGAAYYTLSLKFPGSKLALSVVETLFIYAAVISIFFFIFVLAYTFTASRDYKVLEEYAKSLARGELDSRIELSPVADKDIVEIYKALDRLRRSLILSQELLKRKEKKAC